MANDFVRVEHLTKRFGELLVLDDVSFTISRGEFLCVVGPTGCGKTTFLSCLTGAHPITAGAITVDGEKADPRKCNIAYIMQEYSTMPWLTVAENVAFGLKMKHVPKRQAAERVREVMARVGLTPFQNAYPRELSASMLQRVAIARAFAVKPKLLLLDEPYGQLDLDLRFRLEDELLKLWRDEDATVVFITHNIEEALYLGQRVLILTNKPTTIKEEIAIDLPYPRDVADDAFIALRNRVTAAIKWW